MSDAEQPEQPIIEGEIVEDAVVTPTGYTEGGVPTFDYVREQVENRSATSIGATELAGESQAGRAVEEQFEAREQAGKDRLEEIRRAMRKD